MASSPGFSTPRSPFASAAPLAHRPLSAIAATVAGGVPQNRIQRILGELIPALDALHRKGRICGDISVHSVGLDESGYAHLMALASHATPVDRLHALTTGYAPFELYTDSADWPRGPWTDVYALSAVVYSLIAGQCPPPATERGTDDRYQPLITLGLAKYTDEFLQAIDAGLALRPADRPQTMQAYAESLGLTVFAQSWGDEGDVTEVPLPSVTAQEASHRSVFARGTFRTLLFGTVAVGVAAYWWGWFAGEPQQVITHSERVVSPLHTNAATPSAAAPTPDRAVDPSLNSTSAGPVDIDEAAPVSPEPHALLTQAPSNSNESDEGLVSTTQPGLAVHTEPAIKLTRKVPAEVKVGINVRPWGEIVIDGVSRGVTPPLKTVMLRPGKYAVTIRNGAQAPYNTTLVVTAGKPAVITHAFR